MQDAKDHVASVKGPNQCVSEILLELLLVLRNASAWRSRLDSTRLSGIADRADVRSVLSKTSCLAALDLGELSVGDETLTFFLNVWNLMFLHTMLNVWRDDPPFGALGHAVSLASVGYVIGDLGLVTLAALRSKLLPRGLARNDFGRFARVDELNELAWQDLDLVQNPNVVFAMANVFQETPEIRVSIIARFDLVSRAYTYQSVLHYQPIAGVRDADVERKLERSYAGLHLSLLVEVAG